MNYPKLYRKRLIPNECILLKNDIIHLWNDDMIITSWKVLRPRPDFSYGFSIYYLKEGYKISKFYSNDNQLVYVYCDIIDSHYDENGDFIVVDLLADVIVYPNGLVKVVDLAELSDALESELIQIGDVTKSLRRLDSLLNKIYNNKLDVLLEPLNKIE